MKLRNVMKLGAALLGASPAVEVNAARTSDQLALYESIVRDGALSTGEYGEKMRAVGVDASVLENLRMRYPEASKVVNYLNATREFSSFVVSIAEMRYKNQQEWDRVVESISTLTDAQKQALELFEDIHNSISNVPRFRSPKRNDVQSYEQYLHHYIPFTQLMMPLTEKIRTFMQHGSEVRKQAVVRYIEARSQIIQREKEEAELRRQMNGEMN